MKVHPISRRELWLAQSALVAAIVSQTYIWTINPELTYGPHGLIVGTELALAVLIGLGAGRRHLQQIPLYRTVSVLLLGLISAANISSFVLVVMRLLSSGDISGKGLIVSAIVIFITNIIVFALWYWELDSPGLTGHKWSKNDKDFQFTQQEFERDFPLWQPTFGDYLYLSVVNAISFGQADARPLTLQAKGLMGIQALASVFIIALILTRSIYILQ